MLLVIDVGNTHIVLGVYEQENLIANWRLTTVTYRTSDEMGLLIYQLFNNNNINPGQLEHTIISSVVPEIMHSLRNGIIKYFKIDPIIVGPGIKTGINLKMENPKELGADRLVNCVAAYEIYGGPVIVIDYGTATTYDVVNRDGVFITGITAPGIRICAEALTKNTALLSDVEIKRLDSVMVKNTVASIQAGIVFGRIGETKYIIERIKEEMNEPDIKIIATGGLARVIGEDLFDEYNPFLTLEGLRILYYKNKK